MLSDNKLWTILHVCELANCLGQVFHGVLGTRFGSLEFKIESLESEKIVFLESEKSVPTGPYWVPNISLQKKPTLGD